MKKMQPDVMLFATALALLVIGVFMVYDASYAVAGQSRYTGFDSSFFWRKQMFFAIVGVVAMFVAMRVPYWKLRPFATVLLALSIIGLALVMVPGIGVESNGAKRWINVAGQQIQPSEFAKLFLVLYLASFLAARKRDIRDLSGLWPALIPIGIVSLMIVIEDMGTAIVVVGTSLGMLYMGGVRKRHMAAMLAVLFPLALGFIMSEQYRIHRIIAFIDPFKDYHGIGYQVCQSLIALGSGGFGGVGICEGRQKLFYLPAQHTDFIFAVFGEEMGLIGAIILIGLFVTLAARGFAVAVQTKDGFGKLLAAGISIMIAGQALLNMLVVTSSVPATGVPLPFISYGGSSLALNLVCIGVLLGISRHPKAAEYDKDENRIDRRGNRRARVSRTKRR